MVLEATPEAGSMSSLFEVWRLLPQLKGLPEDLLRRMPTSVVFQLNAALQKESKHSAKLSVNAKLTANASKLHLNPTRVEAGLDNRKNVLHAGRFLGGASCTGQEMWLQARSLLGEEGVTPIGNYDLDCVGCGGSVTPKGWLELHNPGSQELRLRLFYLPNVGNFGLSAKKVNLQDGEESLSIGDSLREIADMDSLRAALNTAREALHSALSWNRSIGAIVGFMTNSNWLQQDLAGNSKRAQVIVEFVDYVFGRNALNWENSVPFLGTDELAHVWATWKGKRSALFSKVPEKANAQGASGPKQQRVRNNMCRKWNRGICPNQADPHCKTTFGNTLMHGCSALTAGNKPCGLDHKRADHK